MAVRKKEPTYKESIEEIEAIIEKLNSGMVDIDTISEDVRKAVEYIVICKNKISKSEKEIAKIFDE